MAIGNLTATGNKKVEASASKIYLITAIVYYGGLSDTVACNFYSSQKIKTADALLNFLQQKNFTDKYMSCYGRGNTGRISVGILNSAGKIKVSYYDAFDSSANSITQSDKSKIKIACYEV